MEKKTLPLFILTLLLISTLKLEFYTQPAKAEVTIWTVDDDGPADFQTIQEAINAASDGDTIWVSSGLYYENVVVNKAVSLIGEYRNTTIVDGNHTNSVIFVVEDHVTIKEFTIQNGDFNSQSDYIVVSENVLNNSSVLLKNSHNNIVSNNVLRNSRTYLEYCNNCTVSNNMVTASGIYLEYFNNGVVSNNTVADCPLSGIVMTAIYPKPCYNNTIIGNTVRNCSLYGIILDGAGNILRNNNMTGNSLNLDVGLTYGVNDVDTSNIVNGKPVYYLMNQHDLTISPSTFPEVGYLTLINSANITVKDITITHNGQGIGFLNTNSSTIEGVNASHNCGGFSISHANNCTIRRSLGSVSLESCSNIAVTDNIGSLVFWRSDSIMATSNNSTYVDIYSSANCTISRNIVNGSYIGIDLENSSHNLISENTVMLCDEVGFILVDGSCFNTIRDNDISNNFIGFACESGSNNNNVISNSITSNDWIGVFLHESDNNIIYHNNLVSNAIQFQVSGFNVWDDGYPSGGNYWSDYDNLDEYQGSEQNIPGSDGIGDTPYVIDENNQDNYPLMEPWKPSILGDVNGDGTVDIFDVVLAANAFSSTPEDPNWNQAADLNNDDVVDIFDIVLLANNFGKTT